ncbi:MAG: hypothetical protein ACXVYY_00985 [Oryzihumus sp.]
MTAQPIATPVPTLAVAAPPAINFVPVDPGATIPAFEGKVVDAATVKVNGITDIGVANAALKVDDIVRLFVECRVTGVGHVVNKDGDLVRSHVLKPIHCELAPFDATDPSDTGIIRP